jgi:regulator of protease activity HflC (stomatin/prohibitin superfamily)
VVERFGKKHQVLTPGLNVLLPWPIDRLAYEFTLKEQVLGITPLQSVTEDNMTITISGMLYMKITDPMKTAYGVENYWDAMNKLAQSTMRTALGNLTLSQVLTSREDLHALIVGEMNKACEPWGILVLRYNITQLDVPHSVRESMEQMVKADRTARAQITEAQGKADALKLAAAGRKAAIELESEAERIKLTNEAEGRASAVRVEAESQASAIRTVGEATAHALKVVATAMNEPGAKDAAVVQMTKQYTEAFAGLAKTTNSTVFLPTGQSPAEVVASLTQVAGRIFASATKA